MTEAAKTTKAEEVPVLLDLTVAYIDHVPGELPNEVKFFGRGPWAEMCKAVLDDWVKEEETIPGVLRGCHVLFDRLFAFPAFQSGCMFRAVGRFPKRALKPVTAAGHQASVAKKCTFWFSVLEQWTVQVHFAQNFGRRKKRPSQSFMHHVRKMASEVAVESYQQLGSDLLLANEKISCEKPISWGSFLAGVLMPTMAGTELQFANDVHETS